MGWHAADPLSALSSARFGQSVARWRTAAVIRSALFVSSFGGHHPPRFIPLRALALGRRLFLTRVRRQAAVYGADDADPRTPLKPRAKGSAILYDRRGVHDRRRPRPPSPPLPPLSQPTSPPPVVVDGVDVPKHIVDLFVDYCRRNCPANSTVCHLCVFEIQRSQNFTVATWQMPAHCQDFHRLEEGSVRCPVAGCHVRVCPGRDWHYTAASYTISLQGGGISTFDVHNKGLQLMLDIQQL